MQKTKPANGTELTLDISAIFRMLLKRVWVIALVTAVCSLVAVVYSATLITPTYRSGFTTYVNNRLTPTTTGSTSVSDLSASMGLAYVYQEIIISRSVLTEAAQQCGIDLSEGELVTMVSASVSENAPVISVYVEATDPVLATKLAEAIAQVAPEHVNRVVEGSSMKIVDPPIQPKEPYSPSNTRNALLGALIGFLLSCGTVIVLELIYDQVQSAEDLEERYQITVLGNIPDIMAAEKQDDRRYGYGKARGGQK